MQYISDARTTLPILNFDDRAVIWLASEATRLAGIGLTPSYIDSQIAAVTIVNELILVTRNTKDFQHFAGLQLENWFDHK